jgi:hypothetical protein
MEVSAMSLSEREQQALQSIEDGLTGADPRLASLLATFTRLTADEALPQREKIDAGRRGRRLRWQYTWALLWFGVTFALIALALVLGHSSGRASCAPLTLGCAGHAPPRPAAPAAVRSAVTDRRGVPARTAVLWSASAVAGAGAPARRLGPAGRARASRQQQSGRRRA